MTSLIGREGVCSGWYGHSMFHCLFHSYKRTSGDLGCYLQGAVQAASSCYTHPNTPHANTQPLKFACWHCFPLALRQSRAFCLLLLEMQAQRGSSFPAHHCNTVPLHSNCTYHATKALARTAAHHTLASQPSSMQHSMQQKPAGGSKENTTALKVPGRSLSRILVEPNPV